MAKERKDPTVHPRDVISGAFFMDFLVKYKKHEAKLLQRIEYHKDEIAILERLLASATEGIDMAKRLISQAKRIKFLEGRIMELNEEIYRIQSFRHGEIVLSDDDKMFRLLKDKDIKICGRCNYCCHKWWPTGQVRADGEWFCTRTISADNRDINLLPIVHRSDMACDKYEYEVTR